MFELLASTGIIFLSLETLGGVWTLLARIPVIAVPFDREEVQALNRAEDDNQWYRKHR